MRGSPAIPGASCGIKRCREVVPSALSFSSCCGNRGFPPQCSTLYHCLKRYLLNCWEYLWCSNRSPEFSKKHPSLGLQMKQGICLCAWMWNMPWVSHFSWSWVLDKLKVKASFSLMRLRIKTSVTKWEIITERKNKETQKRQQLILMRHRTVASLKLS